MSTPYTPGKGLAALLGEITDKANTLNQPHSSFLDKEIPLSSVVPNSKQPRQHFDPEKLDELVFSIRENGVLQPIVVRPIEGEKFEIIAGERRYRASLRVGLVSIPAVVVRCDDTKALEIGLIENLQRDDLNPMDEADAYVKLSQEHSRTQEEIAKAVSKSRSHVANLMRLVTLPSSVKELVRERKITPGHARTLVGHPEAAQMAERMVREGLNVREAEQARQQHFPSSAGESSSKPFKPFKEPKVESDDILMLQDKLSQQLGMRVKISTHDTGGSVSIYFYSFEQLDDLIQKLDM